MALASFQDANAHLDGTKIAFASDAAAAPEAARADQYVRASLADDFPDHVPLWWSPDVLNPPSTHEDTPALVVQAASLLMASYLYSKKYSEETTASSNFAMGLKADAQAIIDGLRSGTMKLYDEPYVSSTLITQPDFYPNDSVVVPDDNTSIVGVGEPGDPDRKFSLDMVF